MTTYPTPSAEAWAKYASRFVFFRGGYVDGVPAGADHDRIVMVGRTGQVTLCDNRKGRLVALPAK